MKRQSGDPLCNRSAVTRRSRATFSLLQAMKTRPVAAKKVKRESEQTPFFRHRENVKKSGHFQGASIFLRNPSAFNSLARLTRTERPGLKG